MPGDKSGHHIQLEICTASVEDCLGGQAGGADRVELNSALQLGGLTPSLGTLIHARDRLQIPIIAMVRPRAGAFLYSRQEFLTLQRDIDLLLAHGADGIAVGLLREDGTVDRIRTGEVARQVGSHVLVFHRAFDVTPDPLTALEQLIDLGVSRVMTSGQEPTALQGSRLISQLVERAAGRMEILPASGIRPDNVRELLRQTGCGQVHASLRHNRLDPSGRARPLIAFGASNDENGAPYPVTDDQAVRSMRRVLDDFALGSNGP